MTDRQPPETDDSGAGDAWRAAARRFEALHRRRDIAGWEMGGIAARYVARGRPGRPPAGNETAVSISRKVSARAFARATKTISAPTVLRHLDAWERAAAAGHVPSASDLSPSSELRLEHDKLPPWGDFFSAADEASVEQQARRALTLLSQEGVQQWVAAHRELEGPIWQTADRISSQLHQETRDRNRRELPGLTHRSDLQNLYVIVGDFLRKGARQVELLQDDVFADDEKRRLDNLGLRAEQLSKDIQRLAGLEDGPLDTI